MKKRVLYIGILYILASGCWFPCFPVTAAIRKPAVAGAFYPEGAAVLRQQIEQYLDEVKIDKDSIPRGDLIAIVVPHAGYAYSGRIAAYSFKLLRGLEFDTVIVLGVNHTVWGFNDISVWNAGAFKTPLGQVPIDEELAQSIIAGNPKKNIADQKAHLREHSIEVAIPFLQVVLMDFKLVPIVLGDYSPQVCQLLAKSIYDNAGSKKILLVASSDLSHDKSYDQAVIMDQEALAYVASINITGLIQAEKGNKIEMCGYGPVLTLLYYALDRDGVQGTILKYANSGDVVGNPKSRIVGYGAVAFYKEGEKMDTEYSREQRKELLQLARDTIKNYLDSGSVGTYNYQEAKFNENRGVFVTLHKQGELRGCIGYIEPIKPLFEAVIDNAISAASRDYRFPPVKVKELAEIDIEISVLTPPEEISSPELFIPGEHGIIIRKGFRSAVFLPQVAPEQGWGREETLEHLCLKAGLAPNEWKKPGMTFYVFRAEVFGEREKTEHE